MKTSQICCIMHEPIGYRYSTVKKKKNFDVLMNLSGME